MIRTELFGRNEFKSQSSNDSPYFQGWFSIHKSCDASIIKGKESRYKDKKKESRYKDKRKKESRYKDKRKRSQDIKIKEKGVKI